MSFVLQNKNAYYCVVTETNAIKKTTNINDATRFESIEKANKTIKRASKKLKDYKAISEEELSKTEESEQDLKKKTDTSTQNVQEHEKTPRRQFTQGERNAVYNKACGICEICGQFVPNNAFTVDHIIPISKGGTYDLENLQLAHLNCNQMKMDALPDDFYDKMIQIIKFKSKKDNKFRKKIKKKFKKICQ